MMVTPTVKYVIKIVPGARHATADFVPAPPCKKNDPKCKTCVNACGRAGTSHHRQCVLKCNNALKK